MIAYIENELGIKEAFGIDEALKSTILWNNLKRQKLVYFIN